MKPIKQHKFDQEIKEKFNDFEIEPSVDLWGNIEKEISLKPKRKINFYTWSASIAAAIIIFIYFNQSREKIFLKSATDVIAVKENDKGTQILGDKNVEQIEVPIIDKSQVQIDFSEKQLVKNTDTEVYSEMKNISNDMQLKLASTHLLDTMADMKIYRKYNAENLDQEIKLTNQLYIASQKPELNSMESNNIGIRNIGDLVNRVVSKIDNREKKLIAFNTDDDGNSSLVSLNIGFLKFNKRD